MVRNGSERFRTAHGASKRRDGKHLTCCDMTVCPHCSCPSHNILNTTRGVKDPQSGCGILQHAEAFIFERLLCQWDAVYGAR